MPHWDGRDGGYYEREWDKDYRGPSHGSGGNTGAIYEPGARGGGNTGAIYHTGVGGGRNADTMYLPGARGMGNTGAIYHPGARGGGNLGSIYGGNNIIIVNNYNGDHESYLGSDHDGFRGNKFNYHGNWKHGMKGEEDYFRGREDYEDDYGEVLSGLWAEDNFDYGWAGGMAQVGWPPVHHFDRWDHQIHHHSAKKEDDDEDDYGEALSRLWNDQDGNYSDCWAGGMVQGRRTPGHHFINDQAHQIHDYCSARDEDDYGEDLWRLWDEEDEDYFERRLVEGFRATVLDEDEG